MKPFPYLGPSLVVLIAGGVALVATPHLVRRVNDERAIANDDAVQSVNDRHEIVQIHTLTFYTMI